MKKAVRAGAAAAAAAVTAKQDEKAERRRRFNRMLLRQPLAVAPSALIKRTKRSKATTATVAAKKRSRRKRGDEGGASKGADAEEAKIPAGKVPPKRVGTAELLERKPATLPPAGPAIFNLGSVE